MFVICKQFHILNGRKNTLCISFMWLYDFLMFPFQNSTSQYLYGHVTLPFQYNKLSIWYTFTPPRNSYFLMETLSKLSNENWTKFIWKKPLYTVFTMLNLTKKKNPVQSKSTKTKQHGRCLPTFLRSGKKETKKRKWNEEILVKIFFYFFVILPLFCHISFSFFCCCCVNIGPQLWEHWQWFSTLEFKPQLD